MFVADLGKPTSGGFQNTDDPGDLTGTVHTGNYVLIFLLAVGACLSGLAIILIVGLLYILFRKKV
jgi:hypothetical protein